MNSCLPAPDDYYRPERARELRDQADRLETRGFWLSAAGMVLLFASGPALVFVLWNPVLLLLPAALTLALSWGRAGLRRRLAGLRAEADALEAEHQARYGALPSAETGALLEAPSPPQEIQPLRVGESERSP
jgi:hypothetical protein